MVAVPLFEWWMLSREVCEAGLLGMEMGKAVDWEGVKRAAATLR